MQLVRANARYMAAKVGKHDSDHSDKTMATTPIATGFNPMRAALADLDSVIHLSPSMPIAYFNKGVILTEEGDFTSALQCFNKAIELRPDFGEAYFNRGYVYLSLGNRDAAFTDLSRAGGLGIVPSYNLLKRMSAR